MIGRERAEEALAQSQVGRAEEARTLAVSRLERLPPDLPALLQVFLQGAETPSHTSGNCTGNRERAGEP